MVEDSKEGGKDLVAARMRFIERMRARPEVLPKGSKGELLGSGPPNRHGAPRMPVSQHEVTSWPVLDLGDTPEIERADWRLEVAGLVAKPLTLTFEDLLALPQVEMESDFHCVTSWSLMDSVWGGVRFRDLAEHVVPLLEAAYLLFTGYDVAPGTDIAYTTNLPLGRALDPDVMLVHTWDGAPLPTEHGGPCRMITPRLYAWKGAKWIRRIEFLSEEQLGFWELRGYSNTAEPWAGDRFSDPNAIPPGY